MRILCDTNVLISGILFPNSIPGKVLRIISERERLVLATYVIEELYRVFQRKFPDQTKHLERYLENKEFELVVTPSDLRQVDFPPIRDAKDEPVLASAILSGVDFLVTGDKDFATIEIDKPMILTPAAFLELLKRWRIDYVKDEL